jgi:hypothetical protein
MEPRFPRLSVRIIEPSAFSVTIWFRETADAKRVLILKDAAAGSIKEAHDLIKALASKYRVPAECVDINSDP